MVAVPRTPLEAVSDRWSDPGLFSAEVHRLHRLGRGEDALEQLADDLLTETDPIRKARMTRFAKSRFLWRNEAKAPDEWKPPFPVSRFLPLAKILGSPWYPSDLSEDWREHQYQVRTLSWVARPFPWLEVPIWPTSTWITSFGSHGLRHHGPAPFPARSPVWWVASGTVLAMGSLFAGLFLWFVSTPRTHVWVHNGYPFPVEVAAGDETREIGPHGHWDVGLFEDGPLAFGAWHDGTLFDVAKVDLRGGTSSKLIYNVNERGGLRAVDDEQPPFWLGTDAVLYPTVPSRVFTDDGYGPVVEAVVDEASGGALALTLGREIGREHGLRVARAVLELEPDDVDAHVAVDQLLADDPAARTAFYESLGP